MADLLILLGQESRRCDALREALESVGVSADAVLASLAREEEAEMLAALSGAEVAPPGGGDSSPAPPPPPAGSGFGGGGGDDGSGLLQSRPLTSASTREATAMGAWEASDMEESTVARLAAEEELIATLPPPGRGIPAARQPAAQPLLAPPMLARP
jgi:hypothetical protein